MSSRQLSVAQALRTAETRLDIDREVGPLRVTPRFVRQRPWSSPPSLAPFEEQVASIDADEPPPLTEET